MSPGAAGRERSIVVIGAVGVDAAALVVEAGGADDAPGVTAAMVAVVEPPASRAGRRCGGALTPAEAEALGRLTWYVSV